MHNNKNKMKSKGMGKEVKKFNTVISKPYKKEVMKAEKEQKKVNKLI